MAVYLRRFGIVAPLLLLLGAVFACGDDATPEVVEVTRIVPGVTVEQVEVPQTVIVVATPTPGDEQMVEMIQFGGKLTMPIYAGPTGFDPHEADGTSDGIATSPLYNQLIEFNPETDDRSDLRGDLVSTWEVTPDGQGYIFTIVDNALWADGRSITVDDVVWSIERIMDPEASRPRTGQIREYHKSVRALDDSRVEWGLQFPSQSALFYLAIDYMKVLPKHWASVNDVGDPDNIMGSGPFQLKEFKKDISYTHERRDDYWKRPFPYLDELQVFVMTEAATIIAAFKTGRVMTSSNPTTGLGGPDDARLAQDLEGAGTHTAKWTISPSTMGIRMNWQVAPFDDPRVRKAIHLGVNRQQIIDDMTPLGKAPPSVPLMAGYGFSKTLDEVWELPGYRSAPDGSKHPDDLAEAQRLLAEAGYGDGFSVEMTCRSILDWCQVAEILGDQLKTNLNIDVTVQGGESRVQRDRWNSGDWEIAFDGAGFLVVEPDAMMRIYRCCEKSYRNYQEYESPIFEDFADRQARELDPVARRAILQEAEDWILSFEGPEAPTWAGLYVLTLVWMVNNDLMNHHHVNGDHDGMKFEHLWLAQ